MTARLRISRPTRWLCLLALGAGIALDLGLAAWGQRTGLSETAAFLEARQGSDSWGPMQRAYDHLVSHPDEPLYDRVFFERRVKFIYPPTSLLLFAALDAALPRASWPVALNALSWILVGVGIAFAVAVLERGLRRGGTPSRVDLGVRIAAATLLSIGFYPVVRAYALGQMQVWVNALAAALVYAWMTRRRALAGVAVALMAAVKPQYALLGVWGLLRREWGFAGAAALAFAALLGASMLEFGFSHHPNYLEVVAHVSRLGEAYYANQTVNGLLHRLLGHAGNLAWNLRVYPPYDPIVHGGTLASSALLLGASLFWLPRPGERGRTADLCTALLAVTLASPIAWEHHYGVLLPIYAFLLPRLLEQPVFGRVTLVCLAASYVAASSFFPIANRWSQPPQNLVQSYLFFAALAALALLLALGHAAGRGSSRGTGVR